MLCVVFLLAKEEWFSKVHFSMMHISTFQQFTIFYLFFILLQYRSLANLDILDFPSPSCSGIYPVRNYINVKNCEISDIENGESDQVRTRCHKKWTLYTFS